ncbi:3-isopropylmalate dehydrogenase [Nesterenkonia sp. NBAIMH1]|uniref:3-isopropylmalate dehydrogenase n=1 Tax=Nesterenkonia sp. NBAIMH1 TaxID=2600320 RepID=UPI0011B35764|nr:3-isopropylmalate dehydrogenase [Nesterenkonia sp. NBAIMH1]
MAEQTFSIAVIPGDGIGPEVTAEAKKVLDAALEQEPIEVSYTEYPLGAEHWLATGEALSRESLEQLKSHDAILFGAVGADPRSAEIPSGLIERELLLKLRFSLDHYINLRPVRTYPGVATPLASDEPFDFVVVREGTEGPYAGTGGTLRGGTPAEIANEVSVNTAHGVRRVIADAFERAEGRRRHVTMVHKTNVMTYSGSLYQRLTEEVAALHPQVTWDYMHVDAATIHMVTNPQRFDVIVTDNLFGDILTDLAGAITGGIGLSPSGSINASGEFPSLFEPVHGSAPDIAGRQIADPTAAVLSAKLMLEHLGMEEPAERIESAVNEQLTEWAAQSAADLTTSRRGDAFVEKLRRRTA